ncbi:MAG: TM2 domain-containing protein [Bacteroidaceae bacterium]|nr:TM2 domain-containing protein [Bacteroidaceae bacterium]
MDNRQVDQIMMTCGSKLPIECYNIVRDKLASCEDPSYAYMVVSQLKDPTISIVLSVLVGEFGIDRFYVGDIGLGIVKLITGGCCGVWWLVDLFLIMETTRRKNLETLMMQLR